jgi:hypothetical protein
VPNCFTFERPFSQSPVAPRNMRLFMCKRAIVFRSGKARDNRPPTGSYKSTLLPTYIQHRTFYSLSISQFQDQFAKMVHTLPFGNIQVPVPGFGAMGLSSSMGHKLTYDEAEPVLLKAIELGCTFWDTAVCYGTMSLFADNVF